jgi:hypothetical protein
MSQRTGECVYCGRQKPLTEDHIPPKALWVKPRPEDLIVVPSCSACNVGSSKDDEYFKTMLVLKERSGDHPEAMALRASVFRGLAMPAKTGFRRRLLRAMRWVALRSRAGLHLGDAPAFDVDLARLDRVVARVIRGLYWHHHDRVRLPFGCEVLVWAETGLQALSTSDLRALREDLIRPCLAGPAYTVGRGVLRYWYARSDTTHVTGWILEFYGDVRFIGATRPEAAQGEA